MRFKARVLNYDGDKLIGAISIFIDKDNVTWFNVVDVLHWEIIKNYYTPGIKFKITMIKALD